MNDALKMKQKLFLPDIFNTTCLLALSEKPFLILSDATPNTILLFIFYFRP